MERKTLTTGEIKPALFSMALPLMGVAFVQMTYNMVDMFWLGRHSSEAVAAVGTAGMVSYIANSISMLGRIGASTWISQSYGRGDEEMATGYIENGLITNVFIALVLSIVAILNIDRFLGFFDLTEEVYSYAYDYIKIMAIGFFILFSNPMFASGFNSIGDSKTPFYVSFFGLIANFILDPLFIFTFDLGVKGAAIATVGAQALVLLGFIFFSKRSKSLMKNVSLLPKPDFEKIKRIASTGWPSAVQATTQALVATKLNTMISSFGAVALAVFTIGVQIESITWMTADGFAIALSAFMGQNLGAKEFERIERGYIEGMKIFTGLGVITSLILFFFGGNIFSIFLPDDPEAITMGATLLKIWAFAEIFMSVEIGTNGSLNGLGLTKFPAMSSLTGNLLRIPIAYLLMGKFGINGLWMTFAITMVLKGIFSTSLYQILKKRTYGFRTIKVIY